jgi:hypothetical protein
MMAGCAVATGLLDGDEHVRRLAASSRERSGQGRGDPCATNMPGGCDVEDRAAGVVLHWRWRWALQGRPCRGGPKPPQAASVNEPGAQRSQGRGETAGRGLQRRAWQWALANQEQTETCLRAKRLQSISGVASDGGALSNKLASAASSNGRLLRRFEPAAGHTEQGNAASRSSDH